MSEEIRNYHAEFRCTECGFHKSCEMQAPRYMRSDDKVDKLWNEYLSDEQGKKHNDLGHVVDLNWGEV